MSEAVVTGLPARVPGSPRLSLSSSTSQGLGRFPISPAWRLAVVAILTLSIAAVMVPLLNTSSVAYTFLSVQVNSNGPTNNIPTNVLSNQPAAWGSQQTDADCQYLSGRIRSLSELYANPRRACDMRDPEGEYTRGSWLRNCDREPSTLYDKQLAFAGYAKDFVPTARHDACYKSDDASILNLKTKGLLFNYQPDSCELVSFNSMVFAEMLRRQKFYFVGDSLTEQLVNSIRALTGMAPHFNKSYILVNHKTLRPMDAGQFATCMDSERKRMAERLKRSTAKTLMQIAEAENGHGVCGDLSDPYLFCMAETIRSEEHDEWALPELPAECPTDTYRYADKSSPKFAKQYHRSIIYQEWPQHLDSVDVLVLGTGHHWWKEEEMVASQQRKSRQTAPATPFALYNDMIRGVFEYLRHNFKGKHIVFLTATAGHYNCQDIKEVVEPAAESQQDVFNWRKPIEAQKALTQIATEAGIAEKLIVLNFTMTESRSDHHPGKDCLHWCEPGVTDTEAHLLYNLLLQLGYADDIRWP